MIQEKCNTCRHYYVAGPFYGYNEHVCDIGHNLEAPDSDIDNISCKDYQCGIYDPEIAWAEKYQREIKDPELKRQQEKYFKEIQNKLNLNGERK